MIKIELSYADWKNEVDTKDLKHFSYQTNDIYNLIAIDEPIYYFHKLDQDNEEDYITNYLPRANEKAKSVDALGYPAVVTENPSGDFDTLVSHNWCDSSTWTVSPADSTWEVAPSPGKILEIGKSEVQFEHDIVISGVTKLYIDYYIWHPLYPGTPVVGKTVEIDSVQKIYELGNAHYHSPAIGTEVPSGMTTVQFNYRRALTLHASETALALAKIVFRLDGHTAATGSYCTVGLVVTEADE